MSGAVFVETLRRRRDALIAATAFVVTSFMLDTVGSIGAGSAAEHLRLLSVFSAASAVSVLERGLAWGTIAGLLALAVSGGAVWAFRQRDIGV